MCESVVTPHTQREWGKVIDHGVHIYIYIYVCGRKKYLNRTLEIDSPFQTLTVGSRNGRTTTVSEGCVVYCLNVTSRIKDYAFQINRLLQTEVKKRKIQAKKEKNAKFMALQRQKESFQQRQTRLQDISVHKVICSQLETLENRAIIYHFIL